jgi:Trypsin
VSVTATNFIMHQAYNPNNLNNDIGLIGLPSAVALGPNVAVIRLPTTGQVGTTFAGVLATVSGFGRTTQSKIDGCF